MSPVNRRILFVTQGCCLDDYNGAAVASRAMMERLARLGFEVEALCGAIFETDEEVDINEWIAARGLSPRIHGGEIQVVDAGGLRATAPRRYRLVSNGVPVTLLPGETSRPHAAEGEELAEFIRLFAMVMDRFRPDVVVNYGGDELAHHVRSIARSRGPRSSSRSTTPRTGASNRSRPPTP